MSPGILGLPTSESRSGYSASYTYGANGNRATKALGGTADTYHNNDVDELTSITQGLSTIKSYTYDNAGRTKTVVVGGNTTSLDYDYDGRLTTITYPSTATNTFTYNALDARVGKVDSAGTFTYKRDGAAVDDSLLSDGAAAFTPGISERRSGITKFYCQNELGSVSRITNTSQTTTDTRQYDAFGLQVATTGSTPTPFGFAGSWGYQEDTDSGLKLLGHRYYDPSIGRFISKDRTMNGRNWYTYCDNKPNFGVDPLGFWRALVVVGNHAWYERFVIDGAIEGWIEWMKHQGATNFDLLLEPSDSRFVKDASATNVEGIIYIGHGLSDKQRHQHLSWSSWLNDDSTLDSTTIHDLGRKRKRPLRCALIWACNSDMLLDDWLGVSDLVGAWDGMAGIGSLFSEPPILATPPYRLGGGGSTGGGGGGNSW